MPKANGYKLPAPLPLGLIVEDLNKTKWKLGPSIGKGGFGEIYSVQDSSSSSKTNYPYVIKIEPHSNGPLFVEMHFYLRNGKRDQIEEFQTKKKLTSFGMPKYIGSGSHEYNGEKYRFVVMEKFGTDIAKLFVENNRRLLPETVYKIGIQILDVLEYIHSKGYIHADVKAANILLGPNAESKTQVYLVDFGLCSHFSTNDKPNPKKAHNGTIEYVSRDGHLGIESRRSDLECLGYNLVQWFGCTLPWENNITNPVVVQQSKEEHMKNLTKFFKTCFGDEKPPGAIIDYMKYVTSLKFDTIPDYGKLQNILISGLNATGGSLKSPFKFKNTNSSGKRTVSPKKTPSPTKKVKKEAVAKPKVTKKKVIKAKSDEKVDEQIDKDDSTAGFTEEMRKIKEKLDAKKKKVPKTIQRAKPLRTRKNLNRNTSPDKNDSISSTSSEEYIPKKNITTRKKRT